MLKYSIELQSWKYPNIAKMKSDRGEKKHYLRNYEGLYLEITFIFFVEGDSVFAVLQLKT